jgi:hypothetical protein
MEPEMTRYPRWLTLCLLLAFVPAARATALAEVEALTLPAWLVRDGQRAPLAPGLRLRDGDRLASGKGARMRLRLADGSTVKLGENAQFTLADRARKPADGAFRASLGVVEGAFRFTTAALDRYRGKREMQVRFSTVTVGIRGTDLWGKSLADRDIVALIEGRIELARAGEPMVTMDQPKTWFQAPRGASALPVAPLADDLLARFAAETEIAPGAGSLQRGGRWRLVVLAAADRTAALDAHDRLRTAGFPAALQPVDDVGADMYRVVLDGLQSAAEASAIAAKLHAELGLAPSAVTRR